MQKKGSFFRFEAIKAQQGQLDRLNETNNRLLDKIEQEVDSAFQKSRFPISVLQTFYPPPLNTASSGLWLSHRIFLWTP